MCFSVFRTCGTLIFSARALVRIFASDFVLRVLIFLSSCGCLYFFGVLSFTILCAEPTCSAELFLVRYIFASAPWDISFIV